MTVFVILHYLAEEMTLECINKLRVANQSEEYRIIVVDNHSPNGTGESLKKKLAEYSECQVILAPENIGFARGNNLGYQAAKEFNPDFIVIMNNDLIIEDPHFCDKIRTAYEETGFAVLGPDIITKKKCEHQNPVALEPMSREALLYRIAELQKDIKRSKLTYYSFHLTKKLCEIVSLWLNRKEIERDRVLYDVMLHGACMVFSSDYFHSEENAFHPGTFLYYEENILHLMCLAKKYRTVYYPMISVTHYEDVATNYLKLGKYEKKMRMNKIKLESAKLLLSIMDGEKG